MHQWKIGWQIVFKMVDPFGYLAAHLFMKVVSLSILSNQEGQLNIRALLKKLRVPLFRKAFAWWQIT